MQLKYRITIVYTIIVTVILSLLCTAIYIFSTQNRIEQFHKRLRNKAYSTVTLIDSKELNQDFIKLYNRTSPSSLFEKNIEVTDANGKPNFSYSDDGRSKITVTKEIVNRALTKGEYFFREGDRDAIALARAGLNNKYIVVVAAYDSDREDWLYKLRLILLICFLGSICIVVVSGYIFSLKVVQPFAKLKQNIDHISYAEFSTRLDAGNGKDELQQLAMTINDLLDRLQLSFDTQRRFIDNASHEMSTPLTAIYSQLDVVLQKERDTDDYRKVLVSVKEDVKELNILIRTLLEIAKASGSAPGLELTEVRVDELLLRMPVEMKKISPRYNVVLEFAEFPEDESASAIYGNEPLLFIAIKNMVYNACKYSSNATAIVILSFTDKSIIVKVQDNGMGMDEHDLKNIFEPFYRGSKQHSQVPGAGLGLALVRHIVRLHNGYVTVTSKVGEGSIFTLTLPIQ